MFHRDGFGLLRRVAAKYPRRATRVTAPQHREGGSAVRIEHSGEEAL
jgi:hypothetical protein